MQIVYLSARPKLLSETLRHLRHFAPFVDHVVVVSPERLAGQMIGADEVLTDETITGRTTEALAALDHTTRNYVLRAAAATHDIIAPTFIMSDDDSRPLVPIDETVFVDGERHRRRWFHTMSGWRRNTTPFDEGQLNTWVILRQLGVPEPLSYASHMPQIVDKAIYNEVTGELAPFARRHALDEWSSYFNIGPKIEADRFAHPEPFLTLGWPTYPGEWPHQVTPPRHVFENHHPELHEPGGLYDGLSTDCDPDSIDATNLEKMLRWLRLDIQVRDLAFPDDIDQPWTSPSTGRRIAFRGLRAARGAFRYVSLDERARVSELEGRIQRLELERHKGEAGS